MSHGNDDLVPQASDLKPQASGSPASGGYEMVVGLEVHVHLLTRTKLFCPCPAGFGGNPNANTCPVCLALPGALPVINSEAVRLAVRAASALGCTIHEASVFARKNYFYPDLPKGYQISQFDRPLATGGTLAARPVGAPAREVGITRIHMEEDAGKSLHDRFPGQTAIDLNRSGVPLVEIVTEPDLRSAAEAGAFLRHLKQVLEYAEVSDANMEEGSLRVDANVSARVRGDVRLGVKVEIKNMNSFSGVERAIDAEFTRQCALLDKGEKVVQQTMLWDAARGAVRPARGKEESHDYRYFPEPDLPPLCLTMEWIASVGAGVPELPEQRRRRFIEGLGLREYDAEVLTATKALADYFEEVVEALGVSRASGVPDPESAARLVANWIAGEVLARLNDGGIGVREYRVTPPRLAALLAMVGDGVLSNSAAKRVLAIMSDTGEDAAVVADREGLRLVGDDSRLSAWVDEVLAANPDEATRFLAGDRRLQGVLVGLVMKASGGKADPRKVSQLLGRRV